jgi:hypothetical protein
MAIGKIVESFIYTKLLYLIKVIHSLAIRL